VKILKKKKKKKKKKKTEKANIGFNPNKKVAETSGQTAVRCYM